jgi:hypothetical protein
VSNLIKLNTQPTDQYDWNLIEDHSNRTVAKSTVSTYVTQWSALRTQADKLIETNTLALSRCVYTLKETLPHGEFTSVCQQALKLDAKKQAALANVGKALMHGDIPEEALKLLNQMEPRAAAQFLKADEVAKKDYVVHFEETGRVPSQRDFQTPSQDTPKPKVSEYKDETVNPVVEVTQNKWEAKDRFTAYKIRPVHALEALVDMLSSQNELRPDVETALISLAKEADRLLALRAK